MNPVARRSDSPFGQFLVVICLAALFAGCQLLPITVVNTEESAMASWSAGLSTALRLEDEITGKIVRWDRRDPELMRELVGLREEQATAIESARAPTNAKDLRSRWFKIYKQYAEWCRIYAEALEAAPRGMSAAVFAQSADAREINALEDGLRSTFAELVKDYDAWRAKLPRATR